MGHIQQSLLPLELENKTQVILCKMREKLESIREKIAYVSLASVTLSSLLPLSALTAYPIMLSEGQILSSTQSNSICKPPFPFLTV